MNFIIISGTVTSEVKVINTNSGTPFCRFTIESDGRKFNCFVAGSKAYDFLYEVENETQLTIDARINDKMQLVINSYTVDSKSSNFGKLFDYRGRQLPHKKVYSF
ncbi:ssDNA-binding protein [Carnobacterium maltaromaticum]|uniref:ssDNA-binding protein n=1 Tax=Carnobacterium maltaromaticum TaxID=2751 RepID=UPI0012F8DE4C|nr:ssDNA-binding protein [Carnobacterium maltaromaticum]